MATMSLGQSVAFPNAWAMISRTTDPDRQGQMLGLNNASGALARVLGPMMALNLFSSVNHNGPFYRRRRRSSCPAICWRWRPGARLGNWDHGQGDP